MDPDRDPLLDPIDRLSEVMFGLLMTLTFTGTMSVAIGDGGNVRTVLLAALGCNLAWGIVDGVMHVLTSVTERGRDLARFRAIRAAGTDEARRHVRSLLPHAENGPATDLTVDAVLVWMKSVRDDGQAARVTRKDIVAASRVFLLVVGATLPPALPFLLFDNVHIAMRASNGIAVVLLILIGWQLDRLMDHKGTPMRLVVPVLGCLMVAVTIALGG